MDEYEFPTAEEFIETFADAFSQEELVTYASLAALLYGLVVSYKIARNFWAERRTLWLLRKIVRDAGAEKKEAFVKLNAKLGARIKDVPTVEHSQSHLKETRLAEAICSVLRAFASSASHQHQQLGLLPTKLALLSSDPGPRTSVSKWFDVLMRLALFVSFAGIAAVLYNAGELLEQANSQASNSASLVQSITPIIKVSAAKFFVSVAGLFSGIAFLILGNVFEAWTHSTFVSASVELDNLLSDEIVSDLFARDPDSLLSGAKKEEKKVLSSLADTMETINNIGALMKQDVVGGLSTVLSTTTERMDSLFDQLRLILQSLREETIHLPIQSQVSQDIRALTDDISKNISQLSALQRMISEKSAERDEKIVAVLSELTDEQKSVNRSLESALEKIVSAKSLILDENNPVSGENRSADL